MDKVGPLAALSPFKSRRALSAHSRLAHTTGSPEKSRSPSAEGPTHAVLTDPWCVLLTIKQPFLALRKLVNYNPFPEMGPLASEFFSKRKTITELKKAKEQDSLADMNCAQHFHF